MEFAYTPGQTALAADLATVFERHPAASTLRAFADAGTAAFDDALWQALAAGRWLGLALPGEDGGRGLAGEELTLAAYEAGRALAPVPLIF